MRKHLKLWRWLGLASLFFFLLTTAIGLTINSVWLYRYSIHTNDILSMTKLSQRDLLKNYHQLLGYLNFPWVQTLNLPDFPMSDSGLQHFVDVKKLFLVNYTVWLVTLAPSFLYIRTIVREKNYWILVRPFQLALGVPILLFFLMLLGFDRFFITFHELLFRNSDWQFDPITDPIINVLPEGFFMNCFLLFFFLLEGSFIIGYFLMKHLMNKQIRKIN